MKKLLLLLLLAGCTSTIVPEPIELTQTPLKQPEAIKTHEVYWHNDGERLWLTPTDGVKVNAERKDMIRYIKELQLVTCFYEDSYTFCNKLENIDEK